MPSAPQPRFLAAGDTALVVEFGDRVDAHLSALVLALAQKLEAAGLAGVVEVVPTFRSLMVHYDPLQLPMRICSTPSRRCCRAWRPPRSPAGAGASPPATTRASASISPTSPSAPASASAQVVERHSAARQLVYMMGFLPGLPYLGGLPHRVRAAAAREPAREGAARLGRRRHGHDRHLSAGKPRAAGTSSRARRPPVGHARDPAGAARGRRQGDVRADVAARVRGAVGQGGRGESCGSRPTNRRSTRASAHDGRTAGARARPHDHAAGPGPPGLPAPRRSGLGRARSREPARRQSAGRQCGRRRRAGDRLPGADAARWRPTACASPSPAARAPIDILPPDGDAAAAGAFAPARARVCCAGRC